VILLERLLEPRAGRRLALEALQERRQRNGDRLLRLGGILGGLLGGSGAGTGTGSGGLGDVLGSILGGGDRR
jgi:hypothetical protein